MNRVMLSIQATPDTNSIRVAQLMDVEHTVIPVVALVEGVLWPANAPSPELALAEEFGRFPDGWNGRPVMLDHPRANGLAVSASSPDILEHSAVGQLFNTVLDGTKLKSEIWINSERLAALNDDDRAQVQRLIDGEEVVEVSTGLFMMLQEEPGVHEGKDYDAIWRNIVPDHLAILPEGIIGACSVEDGCGSPRLNADGSSPAPWQPVMRAAMLNTSADAGCACKSLPDNEEQGVFQRVLGLFGGILNFTQRSNASLSDVNVRDALNVAVMSTESDDWIYILAVFQDVNDSGNSGTVVYELGGNVYERSYSIPSGTGVVSLSNDKVAVRPVTQFVPVEIVANSDNDDAGGSLEENAMNKAELVKSLVGNEATRFNAEDTPWLESLTELHLEKLLPAEAVVDNSGDDAKVVPAPVVEGTVAPAPDAPAAVVPTENAQSVEEFIKSAPAEIAEVLGEGIRMQAARKARLVNGLVANKRCKFTSDDLNGKSVGELENLAALANDVTFEAAHATFEGDMRTQAGSDEDNFTAAPDIFAKSNAA